jgi:CheY-like chemotaxis protein
MTDFREKVLLVDDDVPHLASMEAVLSEHFDVRACGSPRVALFHVVRESFHVVCTDWQMPEMTGLELRSAILKSPLEFEPGFVLISAHPVERLAASFAGQGRFVTFLRKPVVPAELLRSTVQAAGLAKLNESTGKLRIPRRHDG